MWRRSSGGFGGKAKARPQRPARRSVIAEEEISAHRKIADENGGIEIKSQRRRKAAGGSHRRSVMAAAKGGYGTEKAARASAT